MRIQSLTIAAAIVAALAGQAVAASSMMTSNSMMSANHGMMMKSGETMMIMPNGGTMTVMAGANGDMMMHAAKPLDKCLILMMGKDGKMYMVDDMKMSNGKMMCDEMMMKH